MCRCRRLTPRSLVAGVLASAAALMGFPSEGSAQTGYFTLSPGSTVGPLRLSEQMVRTETTATAHAQVDLGSPIDNRVELVAGANFSFFRQTALAQARMFTTFCVPNPGGAGEEGEPCDGTSLNEDLTTTLSFDAQRIWRFLTNASGTATFSTVARIIDIDDGNRLVAYQDLDHESAGSFVGQIKTIAKVPVGLPQFEGAQAVQTTVFTFRMRRGHRHRFELDITATANSGFRLAGSASAIADRSIVFGRDGGVDVSNFTLTVSASAVDELTRTIEDLQVRVTALENLAAIAAAGVENRAASLEERFDALSEGISQTTLDVEALKAATAAVQTALSLTDSRVGVVEGQVQSLRIEFNGHTHDCVFAMAPAGGRAGGAGPGNRFVVSCGVPTVPRRTP